MTATTLEIRRDDALGPAALAMIAESEAELAALYPPEVRFAFSPDELRAAGVRFFVAMDGDRPVGCGGIAICDDDGRYGELKRIFVTLTARGRGIARAIVAALEDTAREAGLGIVRLETGEDSPEAIGLYQRAGYARRGPFGGYAENGSSVFMEKRL